MERIIVSADGIKSSDVNYKFTDIVMFEKLKSSLREFGQIRPVNCYLDVALQLICFEGKSILKGMKELGMQDVEVNIFDMSKVSITNLHFIVNEIHFKKCDVEISTILNKLESVNQNALPFTKDEVESFLKLLNFDWAEFERSKNNLKQIELF